MSSEKPKEEVLIGDNERAFLIAMKELLGKRVLCVTTKKEFINAAQGGHFSTLVTDLDYTDKGREGFDILKTINKVSGRKILCTDHSGNEKIKKKATSLNAEVMSKMEMYNFVTELALRYEQEDSEKNNEKVLIYDPENNEHLNSVLTRAIEGDLGSPRQPLRTALLLEYIFKIEKLHIDPMGLHSLNLDSSTLIIDLLNLIKDRYKGYLEEYMRKDSKNPEAKQYAENIKNTLIKIREVLSEIVDLGE